ncbi:MAG: undecaprenyldiphospho-muramoylpentapeptide beta-N-acetylglucosaminyltransferase [Candidatus Paceibacteria bacterium]
MSKHEIRIVLTGGGTGGHIFPLISVAKELWEYAKNFGIPLKLYYVGPITGPFSPEPQLFLQNGIIVKKIHASSLKNSSVSDFLNLILGIVESLWHIFWIMPNVIFSKGGYGALPVIIARTLYRIPLFVHESDAIPGKVNLWSKKFASRIGVAFAKSMEYFPREKTGLVGNPIRQELIYKSQDKKSSLQSFGFTKERKTIFVIGGSQGAKALNDIILDTLPELLKKYQIIHQCGPKNFQDVNNEAKVTIENLPDAQDAFYKLYGFLDIDLLTLAYAASDLVISRAGAGLIFEIAALGKPSIIVPLPIASRDHQRENAYQYAASGGALVLEEDNLKPHILLSVIEKLISDDAKLKAMSEAARTFSKPDAAKIIAKELLILAGISIHS